MHFAKVKNNIVEQVIVAEQEFIDALPKEDGVSWLQTSYNTLQGKHYDPETKKEDDKTPLRGNYAGIEKRTHYYCWPTLRQKQEARAKKSKSKRTRAQAKRKRKEEHEKEETKR